MVFQIIIIISNKFIQIRGKKSKQLTYRVLFRKEAEGEYTAIVPSLPGCVAAEDSDHPTKFIQEMLLGVQNSINKNDDIKNVNNTI